MTLSPLLCFAYPTCREAGSSFLSLGQSLHHILGLVTRAVGRLASVRELVFIGHDLPDLFLGEETFIGLHLLANHASRATPFT